MKKWILTGIIWITLVLLSVVVWMQGFKFENFERFGLLGLFVIALVSAASLFLPGPSTVAVLLAGNIFNPLVVGPVMGMGAGIGELTGYLAGLSGRFAASDTSFAAKIPNWLKKVMGSRIIMWVDKVAARIPDWMNRRGTLTIFLISAIPNPFIDIAGIIAGATKFPVWKFVLSCVAGKIIRFTLGAFLGYTGFHLFQFLFH